MIRIHQSVVLGASALLGVAVLAGCSSSSSSSSSTSSAPAASAAGSASTQMLPPVMITEGQTTATAKVGDYLDIVIPASKLPGTTVSTDKPELVEVTQAHKDGGATFNPGGRTLAPGVAILTVTNPDNTTRQITLTITQ